MFTGLKKQLELSDTLIDNIVPIDHDLVKLKKILNWEKINKIYSSCFKTNRGNKTKTTDLALGLILLKHLYKKSDRQLIDELHVNNAYMYFCSLLYDEVAQYNRQGKKVANRIVSYYEDHSRALPKGKIAKPCEFGVKLRLDMSKNGYITNHDVYKGNISDISMLEGSVESHAKVFSKKFKSGAADRGFYDGDLIKKLEQKYHIDLAIPHKKDRSKTITRHKKKLSNKRSAIEAKISEGKRMCGLNKSYYKGFNGDKIWTSLSIMALNIRKLLRDMNRSPELIYKFG